MYKQALAGLALLLMVGNGWRSLLSACFPPVASRTSVTFFPLPSYYRSILFSLFLLNWPAGCSWSIYKFSSDPTGLDRLETWLFGLIPPAVSSQVLAMRSPTCYAAIVPLLTPGRMIIAAPKWHTHTERKILSLPTSTQSDGRVCVSA